jgi:hypothetical protein
MYEKLLSSARKLDDGSGSNNEYWSENYNEYWTENYEEVDPGFDMSKFAFKYAGCAAIKEYSMDAAAEDGNAMTSATYAVFRLCPADSCNKFSITGCGKNYGEYVVEMETYLEAMMTYYDDEYDQYCMYCLPCDDYAKEDYAAWLQQCYYDMNQAADTTEQASAAAAYQEYYSLNYGDMSGYDAGDGNRKMYSSYGGNNNYNYYNEDGENQDEDQDEKYSGYDGSAGYNWNAANYNWRASHKYGDYDENAQYDGGDGDYDGGEDGAEDEYYQIWTKRSEYYQDYAANNQYAEDGSQSSSAQNGNYNAYQNNFNSAKNNYNGNQNQKFYGYYNSNGAWVQPDEDEAMAAGWGYWLDGVWYPYGEEDYEAEQDECFLQFAEFDQCDESSCGDYVTYCTDWYGDQETQRAKTFNLGAYTECTAYEADSGVVYYIAPHCGSNHFTIKLGVYSDENCVNYIGDTVSISTVLGYQADDGDLNYFPKECISCDGTVSFTLLKSIKCFFLNSWL